MKIQFFLPMKKIPTITSQQKGINHQTGTVYTKEAVKAARAKFATALAAHTPSEPITGAVQVLTKWCHPTTKRERWGTWKVTTPDLGNCTKLFHDVMEDLGFFANDAQIASEINQKFWTDPQHSGIFVQIDNLEATKEKQ